MNPSMTPRELDALVDRSEWVSPEDWELFAVARKLGTIRTEQRRLAIDERVNAVRTVSLEDEHGPLYALYIRSSEEPEKLREGSGAWDEGSVEFIDIASAATVCRSTTEADSIGEQLQALLVNELEIKDGVIWEHLAARDLKHDREERDIIVVLVNLRLVSAEVVAQIRERVQPILAQGEILLPAPEELVTMVIEQRFRDETREAMLSDAHRTLLSILKRAIPESRSEAHAFLNEDAPKLLQRDYEAMSDAGLDTIREVLSKPIRGFEEEFEEARQADLVCVEAELSRRSQP